REASVATCDVDRLAALADEVEMETIPVDVHVAAAQRRQPERLVVACVLLVADADERLVQHAHDRSDDARACERRLAEIVVHLTSDRAKGRTKLGEAFELRVVAAGAKRRVVAVLLTAARVATRRLNVPVRVGTDPHLRPRRRYCQRLDALAFRR